MMSNQDSSSSSHSEHGSQSVNLLNLAPQQQQPHRPSNKVTAKKQDKDHAENQAVSVVLPNPIINRLMIPTQNKPRLIIDQIVLDNFKSYADSQSIGPFHQNFTSVVGPNGSGKSNLIESMLFIFGYKANWMRLNRLNQLIHNSSTMAHVEKATVSVKFKKVIQSQGGKIQQIPSGAFSISRTVKMSGESKYYINNTASTQAQVQARLKLQGIDLDNNRFLILQGEVQQISQMKQKSGNRQSPGLLQYLQDVIGSNVYIDQIIKSSTQYETLEVTKHQKGQLMKLAQIQLKSMNKGKQQAIRYVKKQRQIYQIHNIMQQVIISNNKYESKQYSQKLQKAESQKQRIISEEKQKLKKQAQRIKQIKKNRQQIQNIQKEIGKQKQSMAKMQSIDKNINQETSFKSEDLVKYTKKVNELDTQLSKIINQSDEVSKVLPINREKLSTLKKQIDEMEQQLQKYDKPELKQKLKSLETQLKKIEYEIKTFQQKYKSTKKSFEQKYKKSQNNQIKMLQINRDLQKQNQILSRILQAQAQAKRVREVLNKQLQQIYSTKKQALNQLQKISLSLRQQQDHNKQIGRFNDMFERIMQQNFAGVLGRLGDLGTVPKQYDEIITTCCPRLDSIVVQTMQAANAVVNFLKVSKIGRVTCIVLNTISQFVSKMQKPFHNLQNAVRLFDIIQPVSQKAKLAFYFAISNTIYCQNSQLGLKYSMGDQSNRRRVISKKPTGGYIVYEMNGQINGVMARSGGFTVKAKSKMRNPNQTNQLKQLEKNKQILSKKISDLQQKQKSTRSQFDNVNKDLQSIKRQNTKLQLKVTELNQQLQQIKSNISKNTKNSQQQKQKKQKQLSSLQQQISKLQKQRHQIQKNIQQIEKQQRSQQNEKTNKLRDDYKIARQQYQLLDKDTQKKIAILETTEKRINQNKKNKADLNRKIQMLNKDITKLKKQRQDIETKALQIVAKIKANEDRIQICRKQEDKLKIIFQQEQKQVKQSKIKIEKAKEDVEMCRLKLKTFSDAIHEAEQQLRKQRETYKQLSSTYDFMEDIDSIQYMSVQEVKKSTDAHNKSDASVILNTSIDTSNNSMSKVFPLQRLLETSPYQDLSQDKLDGFLLFTQKMRTMLVAQSQNLKKMSGSNLQIITQYRKKFSDFKKKHEQFEAVRQSQQQLKKKIQQLKQKRLQLFRQGFSIINLKLKQVYQYLTRGGDAELELIDSLDPFIEGINFSVRPPKKAWKQINKLSGGEKTLSSLSLIFALHYYKPTPLYFMDQIDAALDFKNVSIVANYIKQRTKDAQFIIISLRNNMFELADKLVGVYKTYDKTKIVHFVPSKLRKNHNTMIQKQNLDSNQT